MSAEEYKVTMPDAEAILARLTRFDRTAMFVRCLYPRIATFAGEELSPGSALMRIILSMHNCDAQQGTDTTVLYRPFVMDRLIRALFEGNEPAQSAMLTAWCEIAHVKGSCAHAGMAA